MNLSSSSSSSSDSDNGMGNAVEAFDIEAAIICRMILNNNLLIAHLLDQHCSNRSNRKRKNPNRRNKTTTPRQGPSMAAAAKRVSLSHIARVSTDVKRLAKFYEEILGFERIETPAFEGGGEAVWMRLPNCKTTIRLYQRLETGPRLEEQSVADPKNLPRGHHVSFAVSNFDEFVRSLKEKGIETFEKTQPDGKTKQVFFFDPDGYGLEVGSWATPQQ